MIFFLSPRAQYQSRKDVRGAPLLLFTCSLLAVFWMFPQVGYGNDNTCDPWYIFGFIANPANTLHIPLWRQVSRVPAFLPANLLYRIGNGAFIEHGFYLLFTLVPMCLIFTGIKRLWSSTQACFVTVLIFFSVLYISIASMTYTIPALSYGLSAIGLYLIGATIRKAFAAWIVFTVAAASVGSALHAHAASITVIFALPILAYYSPLFWSWGPVRFTGALILSSLVGLVGSTLIFGLLNYAIVGRGLEVFLPQFSISVREITSHALGDWTYPEWYRAGPILGLIMLCTAGLVQQVMFYTRREYRDLPCAIYLAATILSFGYFTFIQPTQYFMYDCWYVFLLMPCALALACLLRDLRSPVPPAVLYAFLFAIMSLLAYMNLAFIRASYGWWQFYSWQLSLGLAIGVFILSFGYVSNLIRPNLVRNLALVLSLCLFFGFGLSSHANQSAFYYGDVPSFRASYSRVKLGINFIRDHYRGGFPNFWLADIQGVEDETWLFRSFARCRSESNYPFRIPDPEVNGQQRIAPGQANGLIVVSEEPNLNPSAEQTLGSAGLSAVVYKSKEISSEGVRYYILLLDLF
jgi:hypothetical protein